MGKKVQRIGIMTGGGDCPGLNAVIRAVTKTAVSHGLEVWGIEDGFLGLIKNRMRSLSRNDVSNILTRGGTILGTSNKANPAHFAVGKDVEGKLIFQDMRPQIEQTIAERKLDVIICIGGDGTMAGAMSIVEQGIPVIGVPKTIDNDLMHTDITFGFRTAVTTATDALDKIHTTGSSHHRVMIVEIMGRNAGWLALESGVASGSDIILLPEIPYDLDVVCAFCQERAKYGKSFTIIAVSEGARPAHGQQVVAKIVADSPDPIRLGGIANVLCDQIANRTELETRATVLGHVQRGGSPVPEDRILGTRFGYHAMELLLAGRYNELVVLRNNQLASVPLSEVAGKQRLVSIDDPLIAAARGVGTCFGQAS